MPHGTQIYEYDGSGPINSDGINGDWAIRVDTKAWYRKTGGVWVARFTAAGGGAGSQIHSVAGAPSNGLGVDGDIAINTVNGDWYKKISGVYVLQGNLRGPSGASGSQGPAGSGDAYLTSEEANGIVGGTGVSANAALQSLIQTVGHLGGPPCNRPQGGYGQFGSLDKRLSDTFRIPAGGSYISTYAYFEALGDWSNARKPMICFEYDQDVDTNLVNAQTINRAKIRGVTVNGKRGQGGSSKIIGISNMVVEKDTPTVYRGGHSSCEISDTASTLCDVGFWVTKGQYSLFEKHNGTNHNIALLIDGAKDTGGNVDLPTMRHFNLWNSNFGVVFVPNRSQAGTPTSEIRINGLWAKNLTYGPAVSLIHDPTDTGTYSDPRLIIDGGSFEYNPSCKDGESTTYDITITRKEEGASDVEFTVAVPQPEVYIQKAGTVRFQQFAFQSDTNTGTGPSGIVALLDGANAVLELQWAEMLWQAVYAARARHKDAFVDFLGPMMQPGGIYENVRQWPTRIIGAIDAPTWPNSVGCSLMSGFGGTRWISAQSGIPSALHSSYASQSEIAIPSLVHASGTHQTSGTTQTTVADPAGSGENVARITFAAGSADAHCRTRYLRGGDSYAASRSSGFVAWAVLNLELYNEESFAVRMILWPEDEFRTNFADHSGHIIPALNPGLRTHQCPSAVTLWPQTWMRVSLVINQSNDWRLAMMRLDHTADEVKICARHLGYFMPASDHHRSALNEAIELGLWTT